MPVLEGNYLDKHAAVYRTAAALTRAGIGVGRRRCCTAGAWSPPPRRTSAAPRGA